MSLPRLAQRTSLRPLASGSQPTRSLHVSATLSQAPRPLPSLPASQASAGTPAPKDLIECITRYPRHPLLQFFNTETQRMLPGHPSHPANDPTKNAPRKTIDITLPAAVTLGDLAKERSSRAWAAPELRTKSSHELHQLWYVCLMERNKLDTSWEELRRTGTRQLAGMVSASFATRKRRVKKTMARIKFVLNERRLALLEAQARALSGTAAAAEDMPSADLYEDGGEVDEFGEAVKKETGNAKA